VNWQNVPRDDKTVKRAVVPKRGAFSFFDYKAIEPRLVAYFVGKSGYTEFRDQIVAGIDPYTAVARLVTGKAEVTEEERQVWKRVFLAILYGAGPKRIRETWIEETGTQISLAEAKRIYKTFHSNWPAVRALQDGVVRAHEKRGYIRAINGRHLHMEEFGDYKLANKLIQGSAAEIMMEAILRVHRWLKTAGLESRMVSVVHDELIFDGPESEVEILHREVPPLMVHEIVNEFVPVLIDHEVSTTSWAEKVSYDEWLEGRTGEAAPGGVGVDPNADLIGFTHDGCYRGYLAFTVTVVETAPWNPAYVNVDVTYLNDGQVHKKGEVEKSSRRADHIRQLKEDRF
jgi:DNA polymerase I